VLSCLHVFTGGTAVQVFLPAQRLLQDAGSGPDAWSS
jgi:hypothetical protein